MQIPFPYISLTPFNWSYWCHTINIFFAKMNCKYESFSSKCYPFQSEANKFQVGWKKLFSVVCVSVSEYVGECKCVLKPHCAVAASDEKIIKIPLFQHLCFACFFLFNLNFSKVRKVFKVSCMDSTQNCWSLRSGAKCFF